jgi:hypothetical protein
MLQKFVNDYMDCRFAAASSDLRKATCSPCPVRDANGPGSYACDKAHPLRTGMEALGQHEPMMGAAEREVKEGETAVDVAR